MGPFVHAVPPPTYSAAAVGRTNSTRPAAYGDTPCTHGTTRLSSGPYGPTAYAPSTMHASTLLPTIRALRDEGPDHYRQVAETLNQAGKRTVRGRAWTAANRLADLPASRRPALTCTFRCHPPYFGYTPPSLGALCCALACWRVARALPLVLACVRALSASEWRA